MAGMSETTPEASVPDDEPQAAQDGEMDDVKAKFLEALNRKNRKNSDDSAAAGAHGDSKVHGEHRRAGGGRTFRRKSG